MPFISTEQVKEIRKNLKVVFPKYKFSVTGGNSSTLSINFMQSDLFENFTSHSVNHYHYASNDNYSDLYTKQEKKAIESVIKIADLSAERVTLYEDADYGSIPSYYLRINIGKWNKPHKKVD